MTKSDAEHMVDAYRKLTAQLEKTKSEVIRKRYQQRLRDLRTEWKAWQGEDSLHEMAFGEPQRR